MKVAQPGQQGVNVSEASATLQVPAAFGTTYAPAPTIRLNAASVKGNVDGQAFSVVYSRAVSSFKFNDYLFANDNDPEAANPRQGMVATFSGTKFPLSPEVTVVAGVAGVGGDSAPALNGNYFGIRTALKPFSALNLALNYATNLGNRSAIGVDGGLELGPAKLSGSGFPPRPPVAPSPTSLTTPSPIGPTTPRPRLSLAPFPSPPTTTPWTRSTPTARPACPRTRTPTTMVA